MLRIALIGLSAAVLSAGCAGGGLGAGGNRRVPGLYSSDVVATPGGAAPVDVILIPPKDDKSYDKPVHRVLFTSGGQTILEGRPDDDGLLSVRLPVPAGPAPQTIDMQTDDGKLHGRVNFWVLDPMTPVALISYKTYSEGSGFVLNLKGGDKERKARPDSPAGLKAIAAAGYVPIYFVPGAGYSVEDSRAWMQTYGIPAGPLLTKPGRGGSTESIFGGSGIGEQLNPLRSLFKGKVIGVGLDRDEGNAMIAAGLSHVYIVTEDEDVSLEKIERKYPKGPNVTVVRTWSEFVQKFGAPAAPPAGSAVPPPPPPPGGDVPPPPAKPAAPQPLP